MSVNWTKEQQQVIESRNRNLLVSAAAGSGKTAVLVERIIQMITDENDPVDIDRLLVMTFTSAAAAEMRERIGAAIEEKLAKNPQDRHLQRQSTLVHFAQITTIDSFCLQVIREHFNKLDIDPAFRIGDEGELMLTRADVMKEMLEDYYESGDEEFERFVDTYAVGKADGGIEDYIMQVYTFSQSNPWPELWMKECRDELSGSDMSQLMEMPWMQFLMSDAIAQIREFKGQLEEALEIASGDEILSAYEPMLKNDVGMMKRLADSEDYGQLNEALKTVAWDRMASIRKKEVDADKKEFITSTRNRIKKAVTKLRDEYCFESAEDVIADIQATSGAVLPLLKLAQDFSDRYQKEKKEKNIVDFNDLEHFALKNMIDMQEDGEHPTAVADELSSQYYEILVDEYQDSNYVQEALIRSLSGERFGRPNVFMVGDVKQSIYKFRLARPELFMEKYETYTVEDSKSQKIELHQNFRSRDSVLTSINDIFYRIMIKDLGNIQYTRETALHPGASFEPFEGTAGTPTELLLLDRKEETGEYTGQEAEARMIAGKLRQLMDPENGLYVWDKKKKEYRIVQYRDVVILLRSTSGWVETFLEVLTSEGIPAYAESRTGYFSAIEVETVLSLLSVIDNPIQDIPLAAVLKSPVVGMTDEELVVMMYLYMRKAEKGQDRGIYGALRHMLAVDSNGSLPEEERMIAGKLRRFEELREDLRRKSAYMPIHELLYEIYSVTGYYDYISAMPAGEVRKANLDMLVEKAVSYEKTSYKGLFQFIRYIDKIKRYDADFGEASVIGEHDDTVRIMSIHKSKGLEFPVVFLAGMGKNFNKQDVRGKILIDPRLGIGTDYVDLEKRVKSTTLKKNVMKRRIDLENLGEELRILYVAMTRAKEKLIMTATDRNLAGKMEKWQQVPFVEGAVPYTVLSTAGSYLDWVLMSMARPVPSIETEIVELEELVGEEVSRQAAKAISRDELVNFDGSHVYDEEYAQRLQETLSYQYPYEPDIHLHTKMSVSELKKQGQMEDEEETELLPVIPAFLKEEEAEKTGGATRGTAYHRILELLDFAAVTDRKALEKEVISLKESKKMTESSMELLDIGRLWRCFQSPLGRRMKDAAAKGTLHKEQQFVIGIPAREMEVCDSDELVLIQGIIDAYMEEEDGLVLVDYKTDRIQPGQEQVLADRYREQLDYYQRALEQMTGQCVREKIIYSLTLHKEINLKQWTAIEGGGKDGETDEKS